MPSAEVHKFWYKRLGLTDQEADFLQHHIDDPAKYMGPTHRRVHHSWADVAIFCSVNGLRYAIPYASHILLDPMASKDPKLKTILEIVALADKLKRPA